LFDVSREICAGCSLLQPDELHAQALDGRFPNGENLQGIDVKSNKLILMCEQQRTKQLT
jgi:hypothetical protein